MRKQSSPLSLGNPRPHIGLDLLGSDLPPSHILKHLISFCEKLSHEADFTFFLRKEDIVDSIPDCIRVAIATETITMSDHPLTVLRKKRHSSIGLGMQMLKEGKINAFISSGNTGAILAAAKTTLKTFKGIQRPALLALIPAKDKRVAVLDVGANAKCRPSLLAQFARLGIAFQESQGIRAPKVGLLNIGAEAGKGTPEHQATYEALLKLNKHKKTFSGNIEGRDVFSGPIDVLVTDGFTGNVFLKTAEGIGSFLLSEITSTVGLLGDNADKAKELMQNLKKRLDYSEYPGALLIGVHGLVLKCHGNATEKAFESSIKQALSLIHCNMLDKIDSILSTM